MPLSALKERSRTRRAAVDHADYWRQAAGLGLTAILVPEEFGGIGTEQPVLDLVSRPRNGQADRARPAPAGVGRGRRAGAVRHAGAKAQYLPALADGSLLAAWAMAEAPDQWEPAEGTTMARPDGPDWVLTGQKSPVEAADVADVLLVTARTDAGPAQFLVPREHAAGRCPSGRCPGYDLGRQFATSSSIRSGCPRRPCSGGPGGIGAVWSSSTCWRLRCRRPRPPACSSGSSTRRSTTSRPVCLRPDAGVLPGPQAPDRGPQTLAGGGARAVDRAGTRGGRRRRRRAAGQRGQGTYRRPVARHHLRLRAAVRRHRHDVGTRPAPVPAASHREQGRLRLAGPAPGAPVPCWPDYERGNRVRGRQPRAREPRGLRRPRPRLGAAQPAPGARAGGPGGR